MTAITPITSLDALSGFLIPNPESLKIIFFFADFHEPSKDGGVMDGVLRKLAEIHPGLTIAKVRLHLAAGSACDASSRA